MIHNQNYGGFKRRKEAKERADKERAEREAKEKKLVPIGRSEVSKMGRSSALHVLILLASFGGLDD